MKSDVDRRLDRVRAEDSRVELLDATPRQARERLGAWLAERDEPRYRRDQIIDAVYRRHVGDWEAMTDLPAPLRSDLARAFRFPSIALSEERVSADGTRKFLWELVDGEAVESVLIPARGRDTICISSQAGCALACSFCATGLFGFRRDLTAGEIVDQVRRALELRERDDVGANVVFMGMGEPLLNWARVSTAIEAMTDPEGLDIGSRRITVSTVGVPPQIVALGETYPQVRLAVSLHAARDEVRNAIVPLNRRYPLRELLAACRVWCRTTGKRMTFEYLHLPGVNDRPEDVAAMRVAVEGLRVQINLMRYNPIAGLAYRRPRVEETETLRAAIAEATGCTVTVRKSRGIDIEGACGQLRLAREPGAGVAP